MRNIELKARYDNLELARKIAEEIGATWTAQLMQIDTYFSVPQGKLKLREESGSPAQLITYYRPAQIEARPSDYLIYHSQNPGELSAVLRQVLSVEYVVEKERILFLWQNVRIHLDSVRGLGDFIEFEAVISDIDDESVSYQRIQFLQTRFGIAKDQLMSDGYLELLKRSFES